MILSPEEALAVTEGDAVIGVANRAMACFDLIVATQDWHPADHGAFASRYPGREPGDLIELAGLDQSLWPDHCVMETKGAEFASDLDVDKITKVFRKGVDKDVDSYSGFFDNGRLHDTGLGDYLKSQGVDYGVKAASRINRLLELEGVKKIPDSYAEFMQLDHWLRKLIGGNLPPGVE